MAITTGTTDKFLKVLMLSLDLMSGLFSVSGFKHFIKLCNGQVCVNLILAFLF